MIVRRTRLVGARAELWSDWRYFPLLTNRTEALEVVDAEHRQHAVVELTIRDLKDQTDEYRDHRDHTPAASKALLTAAENTANGSAELPPPNHHPRNTPPVNPLIHPKSVTSTRGRAGLRLSHRLFFLDQKMVSRGSRDQQ
jgi:hypothetical protein